MSFRSNPVARLEAEGIMLRKFHFYLELGKAIHQAKQHNLTDAFQAIPFTGPLVDLTEELEIFAKGE